MSSCILRNIFNVTYHQNVDQQTVSILAAVLIQLILEHLKLLFSRLVVSIKQSAVAYIHVVHGNTWSAVNKQLNQYLSDKADKCKRNTWWLHCSFGKTAIVSIAEDLKGSPQDACVSQLGAKLLDLGNPGHFVTGWNMETRDQSCLQLGTNHMLLSFMLIIVLLLEDASLVSIIKNISFKFWS